jgi:hypothetical protein
MKSLAERQADRVTRKAEHVLIEGERFEPSRAGVGEIDRRYVKADEADAIDDATNATIAHAGQALGVIEPPVNQLICTPANPAIVKLTGI